MKFVKNYRHQLNHLQQWALHVFPWSLSSHCSYLKKKNFNEYESTGPPVNITQNTQVESFLRSPCFWAMHFYNIKPPQLLSAGAGLLWELLQWRIAGKQAPGRKSSPRWHQSSGTLSPGWVTWLHLHTPLGAYEDGATIISRTLNSSH